MDLIVRNAMRVRGVIENPKQTYNEKMNVGREGKMMMHMDVKRRERRIERERVGLHGWWVK